MRAKVLEWALFYIPVALLFSIAPAFFTPWWNWYGSFCVVSIAVSIAGGMLFAFLVPAPVIVEESRVIGTITVNSGAIVLRDAGSRIGDFGQVRVERIPDGQYPVGLNFVSDGNCTILGGITIGDADTLETWNETYDVVIDCGEVIVADAEFAACLLEPSIRDQLKTARRIATEGETFYAFLADENGTPRGVVVRTPNGDGVYEASVRRDDDRVAVIWELGKSV